MSNDLNSVNIIGNLVRDCGSDPNGRDFAYTQGGMAIATLSIASNRSRKQSDGTYADEVSYFEIKVYGKTAENLKPYLTKGTKIAVDGVLKQERWQDKEGKTQSKVVINAMNIQLLGGKRDNGQGGYGQQSSYAQQYQQQNYQQQQNPFAQQAPVNQAPVNQAPQQNGGFQEDIPWSNNEIPF